MVTNKNNFILAVDIGGTSSRFACFICGTGQHPQLISEEKQCPSKDNKLIEQLKEILAELKKRNKIDIKQACFAVAGVINKERNYAELNNLSWNLDVNLLLEKTPLEEIKLANDFEALGFGTNFLSGEKDLLSLSNPDKESDPIATRAVIGAGTGLGHGILIYSPQYKLHIPIPSEAGHCDFAATNELEWKLAKYLKTTVCVRDEKHPHPDYERVVSGPGLVNIYNFLCSYQNAMSSIEDIILKDEDKAKVIMDNAAKDSICRQAVDLFLTFYARAAKNFALSSMATGGVYLGGGIAPKIKDIIREGSFVEVFNEADRPSHQDVLRNIPIQIIMNKQTTLLGAAALYSIK